MRTLQVIGLQRSGTSWLHTLLAKNFTNCTARVIKRHRFPGENHDGWAQDAIYFVIRKRLDHWLNSMARFPGQMQLLRPELFRDGEFDMEAGAEFYSNFYHAWQNNSPGPVHFIDYERLLANPRSILVNLQELYRLERRDDTEWMWGKEIFGYMPQQKIDYYLSAGEFAKKPGAGNGQTNDIPGPEGS